MGVSFATPSVNQATAHGVMLPTLGIPAHGKVIFKLLASTFFLKRNLFARQYHYEVIQKGFPLYQYLSASRDDGKVTTLASSACVLAAGQSTLSFYPAVQLNILLCSGQGCR